MKSYDHIHLEIERSLKYDLGSHIFKFPSVKSQLSVNCIRDNAKVWIPPNVLYAKASKIPHTWALRVCGLLSSLSHNLSTV